MAKDTTDGARPAGGTGTGHRTGARGAGPEEAPREAQRGAAAGAAATLPHHLGVGIGWRPEIADVIDELPGIDWVEAVAENLCAHPGHLPGPLRRLMDRGVTVVPHGVGLGLG
ncbi:multinuclear nonheme iron-dependent oxidase, partial [Streptomyces fuscigenes]|uniref:multinuclear nonheme iron-dependent oxidase n=1 Tax=Streptomyces fuscigenes TaxID=1528880 RepID=UPI001F33199C